MADSGLISQSRVPAPRRLRANLVATLVGNIGFGAAQLGMISVLARFTSTAQVGRYVLALAVAAPVFSVTTLKLRQLQATDMRTQFTFGDYLALRLLAVGLATVGLTIAALTVVRGAGTAVLVAVTLTKAVESILDICYGAMQQREQMQYVARSMLARGAAGLALFTAAVVATRRVEYGAVALATVALARLPLEVRRVRRLGFHPRPRFDRPVLARLAVLAVPLGIATSASSLLVSVPRYVLGANGATQAVGVYAALAYLLTGGGAVVAALGSAASPRLAAYHATGRVPEFRRLLRHAVALGAGLGVAGALAAALVGEPVLRLLYGADYARYTRVLVLLLAAATLSWGVVFAGIALDAVRAFRVQLPIQLVALAAVTVAAVALVPVWGLVGAAVAELVAAAVKTVHYLAVYARVVAPALRAAAVVPVPAPPARAATPAQPDASATLA